MTFGSGAKILCLLFVVFVLFPLFFSKSGSKCAIVCFQSFIVQLNFVPVESVVSVRQASARDMTIQV